MPATALVPGITTTIALARIEIKAVSIVAYAALIGLPSARARLGEAIPLWAAGGANRAKRQNRV